MQPTITALSREFSGGNFKFAYNFLTDDIEWNIVGDKILKGKADVIEFCNTTARYFAEVSTKFVLINLICDGERVAIDGTAEFINKENKFIQISSCDVYQFENNCIKSITSYCIVNHKE